MYDIKYHQKIKDHLRLWQDSTLAHSAKIINKVLVSIEKDAFHFVTSMGQKKLCFLLNNSCHCRHVTWNYGEPRKYYGNREYRTKNSIREKLPQQFSSSGSSGT